MCVVKDMSCAVTAAWGEPLHSVTEVAKLWADMLKHKKIGSQGCIEWVCVCVYVVLLKSGLK